MTTAMSELRWNPQLDEWVITATDRQERTFLPPRDFCPLCPTRPGGPPTEIPRTDFQIVVFENRFSALHREPPEPAVEGTALTPVRPAAGACEVVVYTPQHEATLADASLEQVEHLIGVWAHRTLELGARPDVDFVYVFENRGEPVGVTLHHPHGQIYAYPYLPPLIERELASGREHAALGNPCLWCDLVRQERDHRRRVVITTEHWQAAVPFFARWPYEVHLTPTRHLGWLHELDRAEVAGLAFALRSLLRAYDALFGFRLPYVMAIHQRPTDGGAHDSYHLHFEFYPPNRSPERLKYLAGSELGTGAFINDTLPEETAQQLRNVLPSR